MTPPHEPGEPDVFIWHGVPDVGPATILYVVINDPDAGAMLRPLITGSSEDALSQAGLAQECAASFGCRAELREYALTAVHAVESGP